MAALPKTRRNKYENAEDHARFACSYSPAHGKTCCEGHWTFAMPSSP